MKACISRKDLHRLLDDQLSIEEEQQIDEHLRSCDACNELLDEIDNERSPTPQLLRDLKGKGAESKSTVSYGQDCNNDSFPRIDGYTVRRQIGRGGMGIVYEAIDTKTGSTVAIKILNKNVAHRVLREVRLQAPLTHPNIARVLGTGETETLRPYILLEYVPGKTLNKYCIEDAPHLNQRLELFATICGAIQYAHRHEIIHKDLKPSNILIDATADTPRPVIIDFGLAKMVGSNSTYLAGTPAYMSPEQVGESTNRTNATSDIYALGMILFEAIVGFPLRQLKNLSDKEKLDAVKNTVPLYPSIAVGSAPQSKIRPHLETLGLSQARLKNTLKGDLDYIVLKAISLAADDRYQTVHQIQQDVLCLLNREPLKSKDWTWGYLWSSWFRRRPVLAALVILSFLVVSAAGAILVVQQANLRQVNQQLELAKENAETATNLAEERLVQADEHVTALRDLLGFAAAQTLTTESGENQPMLKSMLVYLESESRAPIAPSRLASTYAVLARESTDRVTSADLYSLAIATLQQEGDNGDLSFSDQSNIIYYRARQAIRLDSSDTPQTLEKCLNEATGLLGKKDDHLILMQLGYYANGLADIYEGKNNENEDFPWRKKAITYYKRTDLDQELDRHSAFHTFLRLGSDLRKSGEFEGAIEAYKWIVDRQPEDSANRTLLLDLAIAHYNLGGIYNSKEDTIKSKLHWRKALAIYKAQNAEPNAVRFLEKMLDL